MIAYIQQHIAPRVQMFIMAAIIVLTLAAVYFYLFEAPLKGHRQKQRTLQLLQVETASGVPIDTEIERTRIEIEAINRKLSGSGPRLPVNQMIAYVIGRLDLIAGNHDVSLVSVKPGDSTQVLMFEEIPFHIEIHGSYFSLFRWLHATEIELGPMIVKQFTIRPASRPGELNMKLVMVAYQQGNS